MERAFELDDQLVMDLLFEGDYIYELGEGVARLPRYRGGRPAVYPLWVVPAYEAMARLMPNRSIRDVARVLRFRWPHFREIVMRKYPDRPELWGPTKAPGRHVYIYLRRYFETEQGLAASQGIFERLSVKLAKEGGYMDPEGPGTKTRPDLAGMLISDGKVLTAMVSKVRSLKNPLKADPDASDHHVPSKPGEKEARAARLAIKVLRLKKKATALAKKGDAAGAAKANQEAKEADLKAKGKGTAPKEGDLVWGVKHSVALVYNGGYGSWMMLGTRPEQQNGDEVKVAMGMLRGLAAEIGPGLQGVIYDKAFRGTHIQEWMASTGTPAIVGSLRKSAPKKPGEQSVYKDVFVETQTVLVKGKAVEVEIHAEGGAPYVPIIDARGTRQRAFLMPSKVQWSGSRGNYRAYRAWKLPAEYGCASILLRHDQTSSDKKRKFNRTENLRLFPQTDPVHEELAPMRNAIESFNRIIQDGHWQRRARTIGKNRQSLNLIGFGIAVNLVSHAVATGRLKGNPLFWEAAA